MKAIIRAYDTASIKGQFPMRARRISEREGIQMILAAGGVPILAHPFNYGWNMSVSLIPILLWLRRMGIEGIEVQRADCPARAQWVLAQAAKALRLHQSGGADLHTIGEDWLKWRSLPENPAVSAFVHLLDQRWLHSPANPC